MCEASRVVGHKDSASRHQGVPTGIWIPLESGHRDGVFGHQSANDKGKGKEGEDRDRVSACAFGRLASYVHWKESSGRRASSSGRASCCHDLLEDSELALKLTF